MILKYQSRAKKHELTNDMIERAERKGVRYSKSNQDDFYVRSMCT